MGKGERWGREGGGERERGKEETGEGGRRREGGGGGKGRGKKHERGNREGVWEKDRKEIE